MAEAKYIGGQQICDLTARERLDEHDERLTQQADTLAQCVLSEVEAAELLSIAKGDE